MDTNALVERIALYERIALCCVAGLMRRQPAVRYLTTNSLILQGDSSMIWVYP